MKQLLVHHIAGVYMTLLGAMEGEATTFSIWWMIRVMVIGNDQCFRRPRRAYFHTLDKKANPGMRGVNFANPTIYQDMARALFQLVGVVVVFVVGC